MNSAAQDVKIVHPDLFAARVARSLRPLRGIRGWGRLVDILVPKNASGEFVVRNGDLVISGNLNSFLERQLYLFGNYEEQYIRYFISLVPAGRRGLILDVGANIGTHSLAFARHFQTVHSFEPNPALWDKFERNMKLNDAHNVVLHRCGLGSKDEELTLYITEKNNLGMGTFSTREQYDVPLVPSTICKVAMGDGYVASIGVTECDAIKIDVQGFEPEVIAGLQGLLERSRPTVWFELGASTNSRFTTLSEVEAAFPYPIRLHRLEAMRAAGEQGSKDGASALRGELPIGDYVATPA